MKTMSFAIVGALCLAACGDEGGAENPNEVITTVILNFAPSGGGATKTFTFNDPDGDGGSAPTIDPVNLTAGMYTLTVQFQNRLEDPAEEITDEVRDESVNHLVLFTGTAVVGPASSNATGPLTQNYADMDANNLPIGLSNNISAAAGTGTLTVTLRHMPPEEPPQKASDTLTMVKTGGVDSIGGTTDAQVNFDVTVQ
ncbi:MAG: hypothetical protein HOV81_09565 [Kofleriaceae bacterium]|nr:hypothetical protein [Kofleriaceae bacterium]